MQLSASTGMILLTCWIVAWCAGNNLVSNSGLLCAGLRIATTVALPAGHAQSRMRQHNALRVQHVPEIKRRARVASLGSSGQVGSRLYEILRCRAAVKIEFAQTCASLRIAGCRGLQILGYSGIGIGRSAQAAIKRVAIPVCGMVIARIGQVRNAAVATVR